MSVIRGFRPLPVALVATVVAALVAVGGVGPADAFWRSTGAATASATTGTLLPPTAVTVPATSGLAVAVSWTGSSGTPAPTGYFVTRTTGGVTTAACGSSSAALLTATSCTDTAPAAGFYTYRVTAVRATWTAASVASSAVSVVVASKLAFGVGPSGAVAGASLSPAVTVQVQASDGTVVPVAGVSVTVAFGTNPSAGTLSGTLTTTTNASGTATFNTLSVNRTGTGYTLAASSSGLTGATSSAFAITAAAASTLVITSAPVSGTASTTANLGPVTVVRQDAFGNPVVAPAGGVALTLSSSSTGTKVFSTTNGGSSSTISIAAGASSTTFYYGDTKSGTPTITVAAAGLTSATQVETVTAGTAATLVFGQQPTNAVRQTVIAPPITVIVTDAFGNSTNGTVTMSIKNNAGGLLGIGLGIGVLQGTLTVTSVGGVATFSTLSMTGSILATGAVGNGYTLQAASPGATSVTSNPFNITAN